MNDLKNLVSVIIPVYNGEKYIKDAINSVLNQTYSNFEIIVVDDASIDNTVKMIHSFNDERIRLIQHTKNQGPGAARNTALEVARGEWIALLDADDQWLPQRLEKLLQIAREAGNSYFIADDSWLCFDTPNGLVPWKREFTTYYHLRLFKKTMDLDLINFIKIGCPAIKPIISRKHINKFSLRYEPTCIFGEDFEFICHLFRTGQRLKLVGEAFYLYRITPNSLTSRPDRLDHLANVCKQLISNPQFSDIEREFFNKQLIRIDKEHKYILFTHALKKKKFCRALNLSVKNPLLIIKFLGRLPKSLRYRIAAWQVKGKIR